MNWYKIKDLLDNEKIPFGIVGGITIMNPMEKGEKSFHEYKSIKEAAEEWGDWEVLQIFGGTNWSITIVVIKLEKQQ